MLGKLANMTSVIIKCQSNAVNDFQITGTYKNLNQKLEPENRSLKIVVKNSTPAEK